MGGFYLDVIKDRLYTMPTNSLARRSAQTAMYHIAEAMVRWLAPILSFTAEEIWQALPGKRGDSVFLSAWHSFPDAEGSTAIDWETILGVRHAVSRELEQLRIASDIGAPLDARVDLYCPPQLESVLSAFGEELRFVFITSEAKVHAESERPSNAIAVESNATLFWLTLTRSEEVKCVRCWHRRDDVDHYEKYPNLCGRCVTNVEGPGEVRVYA